MREAFAVTFALQKLLTLHFFNKKYWQISDTDVWNFNERLTNELVSFEQPGTGIFSAKDNNFYNYRSKFFPWNMALNGKREAKLKMEELLSLKA